MLALQFTLKNHQMQSEPKLFHIDKSLKRFPFMHYPNYTFKLNFWYLRNAMSFQFRFHIGFVNGRSAFVLSIVHLGMLAIQMLGFCK